MEELLKEILNELRDIKNNMVTRQDLDEKLEEKSEETKSVLIEEMKRVADTLETIAVGEAAATKEKLEDKVEAGDMVLKSLIDGSEARLKNEIAEVKTEIADMKSAVEEILKGIGTLANAQQKTAEILNTYLARFEYQDEINNMLEEKIKKQEESTYFIRRDLKELKNKLKEITGDAS